MMKGKMPEETMQAAQALPRGKKHRKIAEIAQWHANPPGHQASGRSRAAKFGVISMVYAVRSATARRPARDAET
jgi:hypothetical protein